MHSHLHLIKYYLEYIFYNKLFITELLFKTIEFLVFFFFKYG